jgi:hypothetical protein
MSDEQWTIKPRESTDPVDLLHEIQAAIELDARDLRAATLEDCIRVIWNVGQILDRVGLKPDFVRHEE